MRTIPFQTASDAARRLREELACKHYKPYVWSCVPMLNRETGEWTIEVYLKRPLPHSLHIPPEYEGIKTRVIDPPQMDCETPCA